MLSRPARISLWVGAGLLALVVLLVGAVLIMPNTESGRAFIVRKTAAVTNGQVQLTGIHGTFPSSLDLDRVELRDDQGLWLWAEHISLRWTPSALLARHINVDLVHVALLHVERAPVPDKDEKPKSSASSIPETDLRDLTVDTLELGKALAGEPASLTVKANAHLKSLQDVDAHLTARRTGGNGTYEVAAHFDATSLNATLNLQEPANGPLENLAKIPDIGALSVLAKLEGPRNAEVVQLSVDAGPLKARANGKIDLQGQTADLNYSLNAPEMSPYEGLSWKKVDLQGRFQGPFAKPTADGHLIIEALQAPGGAQLAALDAQLQGDKGYLNLKAGIDGLRIPGSAPELFHDSRLTVDANVRLDDAQRPLTLAVKHPLLELDAKAITAGHQTADLKLHLPNLKPFGPFAGTKLSGAADLTAHVDYTPTLTQLTADLKSTVDGGAAAWAGLVRGGVTQLQLAAKLSDQQVDVEKLELTGRAISLSANARMDRAGEQNLKAQFDLGLPNLAKISPALAGNMKVNGTVDGPSQRLSADMRLTTSVSVHGSTKGTVSARIQAKGLPSAPQGVLDASGQLDGAPLQVNVEVQPANNGNYHAVIRRADWKSAHADGDVTVGKNVAEARGQANLIVKQLSDFNTLVGSPLAGSINGQFALLAQGNKPQAAIDLEAREIVAGGVTANARISAHGPMNAVRVSLHADSPAVAGQPARIDTDSVLNLTAKELQLSSLKASYHDQDLRLVAPAKVQFAQGLKIQQLKLGILDASIEVDGEVSPTLDLRAAVKNIKPALVNAFVPDLLASGTLNADLNVKGTTAAPTGTVHLEALNVKAKNAAAAGLPGTDVRVSANLNGTTADVDGHLTAGDSKLALTGRAPLAAGGSADLKLVGNLNLALANPMLEADGRRVAGTMAIDTTVSGDTANPQIAGTVRLSNGSLRDFTQGVSLTDIAGTLSGSEGVLRIDQLSARAAPGNINIEGTIGILQPKIPVTLKMTAKNAQPVASNLVTANLNADIQVEGTAREQLDVKGKIHLNHANINIPAGMPPEVAVLDVERDGAPPPPPAANPLVINLHLDVDAPNRILIQGHGLDAEMGGTLRVRGTAAAPVIEGGFELQRGFFNLANSKLTFSEGNVTFSGTGVTKKLDPSLDFTAQTNAAEVTAIVKITGYADAPKLELSSTPDLPQDEILARLLFGEPASQLTAFQLVQTGYALSSLASGGGGSNLNPLNKVQKALGLDRLSVGSAGSSSGASSSQGSSSSGGTAVEAGRYVSSRVYVGVRQDTNGGSKVDVDVDLTKHLKLQAQLGNGSTTAQGVTPENDPGSSLGLAYQFEY